MTNEYCIEALRDIAANYTDTFDEDVDGKLDFDRALNAIGKGHWTGELERIQFSDYKQFGRLQRVVIADILGIEDCELEKLKFVRIQNLKAIAYRRMLDILCDEN